MHVSIGVSAGIFSASRTSRSTMGAFRVVVDVPLPFKARRPPTAPGVTPPPELQPPAPGEEAYREERTHARHFDRCLRSYGMGCRGGASGTIAVRTRRASDCAAGERRRARISASVHRSVARAIAGTVCRRGSIHSGGFGRAEVDGDCGRQRTSVQCEV